MRMTYLTPLTFLGFLFSFLGITCLAETTPFLLSKKKSDLFKENEFVTIRGGCFQMGDLFGDGGPDEKPVHRVCLNDFYMTKYEITQGQWQQVMGNVLAQNKTALRYPVDVVSYYDVERFLEKLNANSKGKFRLPTEAEWEYACRSGGQKLKYGTKDGTNHKDLVIQSGNDPSGNGLMPVGSFPPNKLGLYDMSGNVSEWTADWYDRSYYHKSPTHDPQGPDTGTEVRRSRRGGHWENNAWIQRCTLRNWRKPGFRLKGLGFRLVTNVGDFPGDK